jgi:serine/threonine-protein kinase
VRDAGDLRLALDGAFDLSAASSAPVGLRELKFWQRPTAALATVALLVAASGFIAWWITSGRSSDSMVRRLSITLPAAAPYAPPGGQFLSPGLALSPDGTRLVYAASGDGRLQLYVRPLAQLDAQPLPGTEYGRWPFFSPDGEWIAFFNDGGGGPAKNKLQKVSLRGGSMQTLCDAPFARGGSWGRDGTIVFASGQAANAKLFRISANGGTPEALAVSGPEPITPSWPDILPGGAVLFTAGPPNDRSLMIHVPPTGDARVLGRGYYGRYVPTGHLAYMLESTLYAARFDVERFTLGGPSLAVIEGVRTSGTGSTSLAFSAEGTLVYQAGETLESADGGVVVVVTRDGRATQIASSRGTEQWPRLSPDDSHLAVATGSHRAGENTDIWLHDVSRGNRQPVAQEPFEESFPVWMPDGSGLVYTSTPTLQRNRGDLYFQPLDRRGAAELILKGDTRKVPTSWSRIDGVLALYEVSPRTSRDIWILPRGGQAEPFLATRFDELAASFSRDGRWLAYVSDDSGEQQVYVQPYPGTGRPIPISTDGGEGPMWSHDGRELFYFRRQGTAAGQLMVVDVRTQPTFTASIPRVLFQGPYVAQQNGNPNYDVFRDGQRFVMIQHANAPTDTSAPPLTAVLNWFEELKRLVPTD